MKNVHLLLAAQATVQGTQITQTSPQSREATAPCSVVAGLFQVSCSWEAVRHDGRECCGCVVE